MLRDRVFKPASGRVTGLDTRIRNAEILVLAQHPICIDDEEASSTLPYPRSTGLIKARKTQGEREESNCVGKPRCRNLSASCAFSNTLTGRVVGGDESVLWRERMIIRSTPVQPHLGSRMMIDEKSVPLEVGVPLVPGDE